MTENKEKRQTLLAVTEHDLVHISRLYENLVKQFTGKKIRFYSSVKFRGGLHKATMIRRLLEITMELGVSVEHYMKAQFEQLMPSLFHLGTIKYPPFSLFISDRAVQRYEDYCRRVRASYQLSSEQDQEMRSQPGAVSVERTVEISAERFYQRLRKYVQIAGTVSQKEAEQELERLTRAGTISELYVCVASVVQDSEYLKLVRDVAEEKFTPAQRAAAMKILKRLQFPDEEGHYVC